MQMMEAATAPSGDVGETRDGIQDSRLLLCGEDGTPDNYKLNVSYAVTDWKAPRPTRGHPSAARHATSPRSR